MSLTEEQKNIWKKHISASLEHPVGIQHYCFEQKISKSALYRWKSIFSNESHIHAPSITSDKNKELCFKKEKARSAFLPITIERDVQNSVQINKNKNNLPDSSWLAEVIVKVIRGLQ